MFATKNTQILLAVRNIWNDLHQTQGRLETAIQDDIYIYANTYTQLENIIFAILHKQKGYPISSEVDNCLQNKELSDEQYLNTLYALFKQQ